MKRIKFLVEAISLGLTLGCGLGLTGCKKDIPFTSSNYTLKIEEKKEYVKVKANNASAQSKEDTRKRSLVKTGSESANNSDTSISIQLSAKDVTTLKSEDSTVGSSKTTAGRILTAPGKASVLQVVGVQLASTNENEVVAPKGFEKIDYNANGLFGSGPEGIGSDNYTTLDLSLMDRIQPRSVKTNDYDPTNGFNVAMSNIYFMVMSDDVISVGTDVKLSYTGNIAAVKEAIKKQMLEADIYDKISNRFAVNITDPESLVFNDYTKKGVVQPVHFTIVNSDNGGDGFTYSAVANVTLSDVETPVLCERTTDGTLDKAKLVDLTKPLALGLKDNKNFFTYGKIYRTPNYKALVKKAFDARYGFYDAGDGREITGYSISCETYPVITIGDSSGNILTVNDIGDEFEKELVSHDGYCTYSFDPTDGKLQLDGINQTLADGTTVSISTRSIANGGGVGFGEIGTDGKEILYKLDKIGEIRILESNIVVHLDLREMISITHLGKDYPNLNDYAIIQDVPKYNTDNVTLSISNAFLSSDVLKDENLYYSSYGAMGLKISTNTIYSDSSSDSPEVSKFLTNANSLSLHTVFGGTWNDFKTKFQIQ